MAARIAGLIALAALVAPLPACIQDDGKRFNPLKQLTSTSEDQERELGLEFDRELRKHVVVIEISHITDYLLIVSCFIHISMNSARKCI